MYEEAFSRPPTDDELSACLGFLKSQAKAAGKKPDDPEVWADLAHTLFNVKEFIYHPLRGGYGVVIAGAP